jgi:mRNA interferase RelE/StbE
VTDQVIFTNAARRDLQRLDRQARQRVLAAIERYAETAHGDVRPLRGELGRWRLRVGPWRVLFTYEQGLLRVERILPRDQAYR